MSQGTKQAQGFNSSHKAGLAAATVALLICTQFGWSAASAKNVDWDKTLKSGYNDLSLGNVDEAIGTFQDKCKKYPDSGACHNALGVALKKRGKLTDAKAEFRKATEVEPGFADSYYELGAMLESDKDYSGAAQSFQRYVQLKPESDRRATVEERIQYCKQHI
jgi:Flp pilus assembly protein TadD